jgi:hypothetical protein
LFRRASLASALGYLFVMLAAAYSWLFPRYVVLGPTPLRWHFVSWWAHLWFALAAWAVPRLDTAGLRTWLHERSRSWATAAVATAVAVTTFGFVVWRVDTWQFPRQDTTDRHAFAAVELRPDVAPIVASVNASGEADYAITFQLGPRDYSDYSGTQENLGVASVKIVGDLDADDTVIAACSDTVSGLPGAASIATPATFRSVVKRQDDTVLEVNCIGPAALLPALASTPANNQVEIVWTATAKFQADRDSGEKAFGGSQLSFLAEPPPVESQGAV